MTHAVEAKNFTVTYPRAEKPVFAPLDFCVGAGETVALRGDSGAGKTTLLRCVCALIPGSVGFPAATAGELLLYGKPPGDYARAALTGMVGMVFQDPETQLFCGTAALEVAFGLENICVRRDEMRERVREALETVGLWARRGDSPSALSGGQKQLLALAAVLALRPKLLLLDEAFSQLDDIAAEKMLALLHNLKARGQAMVIVDHGRELNRLIDREVRL